MMKRFIKVVLITLILGITSNLSAEDLGDSLQKKDIYVGFQSTWPSYGFSAKMDIDDKITAQGIVGLLGDIDAYLVRGIYKFEQFNNYNIYGFGTFGLWSWDGGKYHQSEAIVGYGFGGGIEYDIRTLEETLPPLFITIELELNLAKFKHYTFSATNLGFGLHYKLQ